MNLESQILLLQKYENEYYNSIPSISDAEYDHLKENILNELPPDHPYQHKIGHEVISAWSKEKHAMLMGSQNKVSDETAICDWVQKIYAELKNTNLTFTLQHKIDGFSLETIYKEGYLSAAITRGDGYIGENITPNAKQFKNIPFFIQSSDTIAVRGEGVIYKSDFAESMAEIFKNPRNAASGISRRYNGENSEKIRYIAYDVLGGQKSEIEKIQFLKNLGFFVVPTYECKNIEEILEIYRKTIDERSSYPYEIDGLVLKLNDINLQEQMGYEHNRPKGQIALKFSADEATTTISKIQLQVGRTGKITPVAILKPVFLSGSTISKASVHNFDYIEKNGIGEGAEVTIEKKGDIIPQVTDIITPGTKYILPTVCPCCGSALRFDSVSLWCSNPNCSDMNIERISYWITALDMKGFSDKFIRKLWETGRIKKISDLYNLKRSDLENIDGIGSKTIDDFFEILKNTSEMNLEKFIWALGIPSCSKETASLLVEHFKNWKAISEAKQEDIVKLPRMGDISSSKIFTGIQEVKELANELLDFIKIKEKAMGSLTGLSFCVTGSLEKMGRKEFQELVESNGGIFKSGVSAGLTYLVTNDTESGSSKNEKARKVGTKIITEKQFFELLKA